IDRALNCSGKCATTSPERDPFRHELCRAPRVARSHQRSDRGLPRPLAPGSETGLRAGDALHVALTANRAATAIDSLDDLLVKAGQNLGLPVARGITRAIPGG